MLPVVFLLLGCIRFPSPAVFLLVLLKIINVHNDDDRNILMCLRQMGVSYQLSIYVWKKQRFIIRLTYYLCDVLRDRIVV